MRGVLPAGGDMGGAGVKRCPECEALYPDGKRPEHFGSNPQCAFAPNGVFHGDNWQCGTMNKLRDLFDRDIRRVYSRNDQNAIVVPTRLKSCWRAFMLLAWYKDRGCTNKAWVFDEDTPVPEPLTLTVAMEIIEANQK